MQKGNGKREKDKPKADKAKNKDRQKKSLTEQFAEKLAELQAANGVMGASGEKSRAEEEDFALIYGFASKATITCDARRQPFMIFDSSDGQLVLPVRSLELGRFFTKFFLRETNRMPRGRSVARVLEALEAEALFVKRNEEMGLRRMAYGNALWLDLGHPGGHAVRIDEKGWEVAQKPEALFYRHAQQRPLPTPEKGGDPGMLEFMLGLPREDDQLLVMAWLLACYYPGFPVPMLVLTGPQGSGKTTLARRLKNLVDPHEAEVLALPDEEEMARILEQQAVPIFDNLSRLTPAQSNRFCRAVTGYSHMARQINHSGAMAGGRWPMILTALEIPSQAADWLDRALVVRLEAKPVLRMEERRMIQIYQKHQGQLLGLVLDFLSGTMRAYAAMPVLPNLPRMADFATWGVAMMAVTGNEPQRFLEILHANAAQVMEEILEQDEAGAAVMQFMAEKPEWEGTTEILHTELRKLHPKFKLSAIGLGRQLRKIQFNLKNAGMQFAVTKNQGIQKIQLENLKLQNHPAILPLDT